MTNREYLINQLQDDNFIDDSGASYETTIHYNIACPYFAGDERALCNNKKITREMCFQCKEQWLDSEVGEDET